MDSQLRVIEIERELCDTRRAALGLILGLTDALLPNHQGCEELIALFQDASVNAEDEATRSLADLVAKALGDRLQNRPA